MGRRASIVAALPVEWDYEMPFGVVYAQKPSKAFSRFMGVIAKAAKAEEE